MPVTLHIGRSGEFFAASVLEQMGVKSSHIDITDDDLWCLSSDGEMVRVQVKSTRSIAKERRSATDPAYRFTLGRQLYSYDGIYIFVALDIRVCIARRFHGKTPSTLRIRSGKFTQQNERESIEREFSL